jgi:hypothetical protein
MNKIIIAAALLIVTPMAMASSSGVSREAKFPNTVSEIKVTDAYYDLVPTETVTRPIPGCTPGGESDRDCNETVVISSEEVIRVYLSYQDSLFPEESRQPKTTSIVFSPSDFTPDQVALLKSVYPMWKHPFTTVNQDFARQNFSLDTKVVRETFQIPDPSRSKLCVPRGDSDFIEPGCKEEIVYKDTWHDVVVATVTKK